ncbi:hypothetical protein L202_06775 [Cryptococcus amylolentus CBS 6039]|uniref:Squalene monooxygenase n=2 Tax=Cryptococcus amylolentus TaxID=104669 RepID=A0A1E3HDD8_9TREE|nr:hypothetical protein L202_06775 [Cryptococcus amylolentus CBS 6039]ODN74363.1 hypothetical protein L202_06775 [Cryptococcus amylolentus CBS 6039]ODO01380.1 hypothetical protein I350_06199 [Cryptococcus amylolentus CBS 6273]
MSSPEPEIIIIGAGVVGTALAYSLSHTGRKILLIERDLAEPDRIVGELLQPGGVAALVKLGMQDVLEGIDASPVEGYCVCNGKERVGIPYPVLEEMARADASKGPEMRESEEAGVRTKKWHVESASGLKEGRSFHHGRLISALRRKCLHDAPNVTVLEATVRDLLFCQHTNKVIGVSAAPKGADAQKHYAPLTIVADGCFSKFRLTPGTRTRVPDTRSHFVGLILNDCELPMKHYGTVCLTPSGPVLLYQIGDKAGDIRMLVDVKGKLPSVADGSLKNYLIDNYLPHIPVELRDPLLNALSTQRIRSMPNSYLPPSIQGLENSLQGAVLVGDAYNMRHPLTGGGMTVAFNDAILLTEYLRPGGVLRGRPAEEGLAAGREGLEDWEKVAERLREWFWERKQVSSVVNVLSMALYSLFGGSDKSDLAILREGCFSYFELGGDCVAGPVGLLSALTPRPMVLFYHFFNVAFYSIYLLLKKGPPGRRNGNVFAAVVMLPINLLLSLRVFWSACVVLLPFMITEFRA